MPTMSRRTAAVLAIRHFGQIRWAVFVPFFVVIDLVGWPRKCSSWQMIPETVFASRLISP